MGNGMDFCLNKGEPSEVDKEYSYMVRIEGPWLLCLCVGMGWGKLGVE